MLQDHFSTAIYENMKAAAYSRDDDNDDSDDSDSDLDEVSFASGWRDISMNCISRIVQIGHMRYWWIILYSFSIIFDSHTKTNSEKQISILISTLPFINLKGK